MKRDMELVRALLLDIEGEDKPDLSKWSEKQQLYHLDILIEAGLVLGYPIKDGKGETATVETIRLTWDGHEFLDAARNEKVWSKAKEKLKTVGGSVSLPVLTSLLTSLMKHQIGVE